MAGPELLCCCLSFCCCYACQVCGNVKRQCCPSAIEFSSRPSEDTLRIAFTSCVHQRAPKLLFSNMARLTPDVVILGGDNIYIDSLPNCPNLCCGVGWSCMGSGLCIKRPRPFMDHDEEYNRLLERADCTLVQDVPGCDDWPSVILPTWDDHDFGGDFSGSSYADKERAKQAFIRFVERINSTKGFITEQLEEIKTPGRGIQYFYDITRGGIEARIYMLDNRWYRTETDILGEEQWKWLDGVVEEASGKGINHHIFVNGTTMLSPLLDFGCAKIPEETWPEPARDRFLDFLRQKRIWTNSYLISGDVHMSLVSELEGIHEFVSSAHTHSLLTYALNLFDWCVCFKHYLGCGCCCSTHGWPASNLSNVNGFGVLDFKEDRIEFGILSGTETDHQKSSYLSDMEFTLEKVGRATL